MKHSGLFGLVRSGVGGAVVLTGFLLAGCATGPDAHPRDPLEPWNRGVFRFNDAIDRAFLKPAATVYTKATPQFAQKGVRNFFGNLGDAWSFVNSMLQFQGQEAVNSFFRFATNTVFGLGGVLDVATEARIPQSKQDFGLTLGRWGVSSGPYLVLPILGPSSVRDAVALPVDMKGNPLGAINDAQVRNTLSGLGVISHRAQLLPVTDLMDQTVLDSYDFMRDAYLQQRDARTGKTEQTGEATMDEGYEPDLQDQDNAKPPSGKDLPSAQTPLEEGYEPPLEGEGADASVQPAAPAASAGSEVEKPSQTPEMLPSVSGQTPHYWPAVPQLFEKLSPGLGEKLWKR